MTEDRGSPIAQCFYLDHVWWLLVVLQLFFLFGIHLPRLEGITRIQPISPHHLIFWMSPFLFWGQIQVGNVPFHPRFLWSWAAILQIDQDVQLGVRSAKLFIWYIQDIDAIKSTNVFRETDSDPPPSLPEIWTKNNPKELKMVLFAQKDTGRILGAKLKKRRSPPPYGQNQEGSILWLPYETLT